MKKLIFATHNEGKVRELRILVKDLDLEILSIADIAPEFPEVHEDGTTFEENALKKANETSQYLGLPVLADDSGLEVEALDGAPGVYSARFSGITGSREEIDAANNIKLLEELQKIPDEERGAQFRCVLALSDIPNKTQLIAHGICRGVILKEPRGSGGFGYDPLFYVPNERKTFAELGVGTKNQQSHRAQAMKKLKPELARYFCLH